MARFLQRKKTNMADFDIDCHEIGLQFFKLPPQIMMAPPQIETASRQSETNSFTILDFWSDAVSFVALRSWFVAVRSNFFFVWKTGMYPFKSGAARHTTSDMITNGAMRFTLTMIITNSSCTQGYRFVVFIHLQSPIPESWNLPIFVHILNSSQSQLFVCNPHSEDSGSLAKS